MTDLDKLEALAKAATPGPWNDSGGSIDDFDAECTMRIEWIANGIPKDGEKDAINANYRSDAAFIAAANPASILDLIASARRDEEEIERLKEALTPSGATKAAYHGEFKFTQYGRDDDGDDYSYETYVPWTTVKEIMAAIRARAAHTGEG